MKIVIHNLYGINDGDKAYYRKNGFCFDFVSSEAYASELSETECKKIKEHEEWYCKQYRASHMTIE